MELRTSGRVQRDLYVMLGARGRYLAGFEAIEVRKEYVFAGADRGHVGYEVSGCRDFNLVGKVQVAEEIGGPRRIGAVEVRLRSF